MFIEEMPIVMIRALIFTILIEVLAGFFVGVRDKKDFLNVILVNIMTNPLVVSLPVYMQIKFGLRERQMTLIILEILAVLLEGLVYYKYLKYRKIDGFLLSLILNIASYGFGKVINKFLYY